MTRLLSPQLPERLYKYRDIDKGYNILAKKQIWFSKPKQFNDPFDCSIQIRFDLMTKEEFDNHGIALIKRLRPDLTEPQAGEIIKQMRNEGKARPYTMIDKFNNQQLEHLQENVRVFSLSKINNNILLWSHYGNCHTGVCIGFNSEMLYKSTGAGVGRVEYLNHYPELKPSGIGNLKDLIVQVCSKPPDWAYEQEFRFIYWEPRDNFAISPLAIEDITFGCRVTQADMDKITKLITADKDLSHINIFQASKHTAKFELEIKPIEKI